MIGRHCGASEGFGGQGAKLCSAADIPASHKGRRLMRTNGSSNARLIRGMLAIPLCAYGCAHPRTASHAPTTSAPSPRGPSPAALLLSRDADGRPEIDIREFLINAVNPRVDDFAYDSVPTSGGNVWQADTGDGGAPIWAGTRVHYCWKTINDTTAPNPYKALQSWGKTTITFRERTNAEVVAEIAATIHTALDRAPAGPAAVATTVQLARAIADGGGVPPAPARVVRLGPRQLPHPGWTEMRVIYYRRYADVWWARAEPPPASAKGPWRWVPGADRYVASIPLDDFV
jgi:hypothetical protein